MTPSTYELKLTQTNSSAGLMPDFESLFKAVNEHERAHGSITVTVDEAVKIFKSKLVRRFAIHFNTEAPSKTTPGYGVPIRASVWVSRRIALQLLTDAYGFAAHRVLVELSLHRDAIFIG